MSARPEGDGSRRDGSNRQRPNRRLTMSKKTSKSSKARKSSAAAAPRKEQAAVSGVEQATTRAQAHVAGTPGRVQTGNRAKVRQPRKGGRLAARQPTGMPSNQGAPVPGAVERGHATVKTPDPRLPAIGTVLV